MRKLWTEMGLRKGYSLSLPLFPIYMSDIEEVVVLVAGEKKRNEENDGNWTEIYGKEGVWVKETKTEQEKKYDGNGWKINGTHERT